MNNSTVLPSLRWSTKDLRNLLYDQNPCDGLFLMKNRSFEKLEDFFQELSSILSFIKNDTRGFEYHNFFSQDASSFAFVYQKIDALYHQKTIELQSLWEKQSWEEADYTKEKEIKSILGNLIKCELAIDSVCESPKGYTPHIFTQLENLFDDSEFLDALLLVIFKRMPSKNENMEFLNIKGCSFMFPFLKLFYNGKGSVLDLWNNPQEFLRKTNAVEEVQKDIKKLLGQYADLNESEISRFCQEIKSASGDTLARRRILRRIAQEKKRFKEEKGYYEVLGNLGLLLYLWKQEEADHQVFMPLLRVGLVGFICFLDGWQKINRGFERESFEQYWRFNTLNFEDELDLPVKILKHVLNELKKENNGLDQKYLQLLDLNFLVCKSLANFIRDYQHLGEGFSEKFEAVCNGLFLNLENNQDVKSFVYYQLFEFLNSNLHSLNTIKSNYLIGTSLYESYIERWLDFVGGFEEWAFFSVYTDGDYSLKQKYICPAKTLLFGLIEFIASKKDDFLRLPYYLRASLIKGGCRLYQHENVLKKSELEEIYLSAQDLGLEFLGNLKNGVANGKKNIQRLTSLQQLVFMLAKKMEDYFKNDASGEEFMKGVLESKLVEGFIEIYEENQCLLQKVQDVNVTEAVWEMFGNIASYASKVAAFFTRERNVSFLKSVLQDSCEIDPRPLSRESYELFAKRVVVLFNNASFLKHFKDQKLLFRVLRMYIFSPFVSSHFLDSNLFAEKFYQLFSTDLAEEKTFLHLFGQFLRVFENAMRDPSLDLYKALGQFEEETNASMPFLFDRKTKIKDFESLGFTTGVYCRLSLFVSNMLFAFRSDLEKLNQQVESIIKRYIRMSFDPLFVFAFSPSFFKTFRSAFERVFYVKPDMWVPFLEGAFASVVEICKEFKFNDYETISKFDSKRLCKMLEKISAVEYLRRDDIPEDFAYEEAALLSFIVGLKNFNRILREISGSIPKKVEEVKDQFKEATVLVDQVQNNILKHISFELVKGQDIETLAKYLKGISEEGLFTLGVWFDIFKKLYKCKELHPMVEENYKTILQRFDLELVSPRSQKDEKPVLTGVVYNTLRLREFNWNRNQIDDGMWMLMISSPEGLEAMLKFEIYLLDCINSYSDVLGPVVGFLESCFKKKNFSSNGKYLKEGKLLFPVILGFLKELAQREAPKRNSKILIEKNLKAVFDFFEAFYKCYAEEIQDQVTGLYIKIEEGEQDPVVQLEEVEKEKAGLIENYKNEIQKYIDAVVQCQQHHLVDLKELFVLGEGFDSVIISHDYWIKLYEQASGNLALYLGNLLQDSDLKEKLKGIGNVGNQIKLKDVSKEKPVVNQVYQIDFLFQCLEKLFIKEIIGELSLNKDLIQSLLMVAKETLQSLAPEELVLLRKGKECSDFPEILSGLISRISKLAINYIVSHVLENNCQFVEDDKLLSMCLDLTEGVLCCQKAVLDGLRRDIFSSGSSGSCYRDTICLMNAILRANKSLRVEFINRGLLQKLFGVERLSALKPDETISVLCLMTTLLEDSLVLDSQVDLALRGLSKKQEKGEISLEDLMEDKNFKPLQNSQRVLEKLKLYGINSNLPLLLREDKNLIENVQKNLSPVAEGCVQILLKSLLENYSFEKASVASLQKVREQKDSQKRQELNTQGKLKEGYLYLRDLPRFEKEDDDTNVYLDKDSNRQMIQKETGSLVVILSGILSNYPHLIPSVVFQELSSEEVIKQFGDDSDLMYSFKANSRCSILDILLRLVLLKEGSSAVFLIASLIQDNVITAVKEEGSIDLRYILLMKIFEILEDILDAEETQGRALETLNSVLTRKNIAIIVGFISSEMNKDGESSFSPHKEEILQLIVRVVQELLQNPQLIAYSMQESYPYNSMVRIISSTVKQNTSKSMTVEELGQNYPSVLKALKTRGSHELKALQVDLKGTFEKNLLARKEFKDKILSEEQRKFEMWEEKSQWEKEEAQKFFEIAGLKDKELISEIRLDAYGDTSIGGDLTLNGIFSENWWPDGFEYLYKSFDSIKDKPFNSDNQAKIVYLINRLEASTDFGGYQKDTTQSFGEGNIDSDTLLPLLKVDARKIETLKDDTINLAKFFVKEQTKSQADPVEATSKQDIPKDITPEEVKVEEGPVDSEKKEEEKINQENEISFKYFMDTSIRNEANFKFRVNRALQQGKRVKEMICVEKALKSTEKNCESILKQFTAGMKEFDRNVVYASLGKTFEADLSEELRKIAQEARKELLAIQKDFSRYGEEKEKIPKLIEEQKENEPKNQKEEENSEYGELDYDIQFLIEDKKQNKEEGEEEEEDVNEIEQFEKNDDNNEKILNTINSFEVDDAVIMNILELLFCYFNPSSRNQEVISEFIKDSLSLNPVNELKLLDMMITILYTPEFFDYLKSKNLPMQVRSYEKAVDKIVDYISEYFDDQNRSHVFFLPKGYLESHGVALLKDLKEKTSFAQKVSDCHTLLDMLLGLTETKLFINNERWIVKILKGLSTLIGKGKGIKLAESVPQMDNYKKIISCKKLLSLLGLIEKPTSKNSESSQQVKEVFMSLKSIPELVIPFQGHLSNYLYQTIVNMNDTMENSVRRFKQSPDHEPSAIEVQENLSHINLFQLEVIQTIMFSLANVLHYNLIVKKSPKKLRTLLQTVNESLFNPLNVHKNFLFIPHIQKFLTN